MDSRYPNALDDDVTIIRVDDNIVEIGGDAINGLRSAVFNIEETLGINPQGSTNDVVTRLNRSLNADGSIKASALSSIGLVTLPITNNQIASNAGIEEVKLDLDYSTTQLKSQIDGYYARINPIAEGLGNLIHNVNLHVAHPSLWGKHLTHDIDGYFGAGIYDGYNLQGILTDLDNRIVAHLSDIVGAHAASAISVDDSLFVFPAENVQEALNTMNDFGNQIMISHRDNQHDNGILSTQKVNVSGTNRYFVVVNTAAIYAVPAGVTFIKFQTLPSGFGQILRGDRIDITIGDMIYSYDVVKTVSSDAVVFFLGVLPEGGTGFAKIYRSDEELSSVSVLKTVIKKQSSSDIGGCFVQLIHPNAPYVLSYGSQPWKMTNSECNIGIRWESGSMNDIDLFSEMDDVFSKKSMWTVENTVFVLNTCVFSKYSLPLVAFEQNGEIGIAFDEANGYIEVLIPSSNSAWAVLGFVEGEKIYCVNKRKFFIDGYEYYGIRQIIDASCDSNGPDGPTVLSNVSENLVTSGVKSNGMLRLTAVTTDSGSYIYNAVTSNTITSDASYTFSTEVGLNVRIYADCFGFVTPPTKKTLYELFVDGYSSPYASFNGMQRLEYNNCLQLSPNAPELWFDVVSVSRNFEAGEKRLYFDGFYNVYLGDRGSLGLVVNSGDAVVLPTTNAEGFRFKLYDGSKINYIEFEVVDATYTSAPVYGKANSIDIDIYDRISEDKYVQVATVFHNRQMFKYLSDTRIFGTTGRKSIGDDFKRDYISYPSSLLRGNGIVYGFSLTVAKS
jgi:hypothetical protein